MTDRARKLTVAGDNAFPELPLSREDAGKAYGAEIPHGAWDAIRLAWDRLHALEPYAAAPRDTKNRNDPARFEMLQSKLHKRLTRALVAMRAGKPRRAEPLLCDAVGDDVALKAVQGALDASHGDMLNRTVAEELRAVWDATRALIYGDGVEPHDATADRLERLIADVARAVPHSIRYSPEMARDRFIRALWRALSVAGLNPELTHLRDETIERPQHMSNFERLVWNLDLTDNEWPNNEIWLISRALRGQS